MADLDVKLTAIKKGTEEERTMNQKKFTVIGDELKIILNREEEEKTKLDALIRVEKLEGSQIAESIGDLSKIYEASQKKVDIHNADLTSIKKKLATVLEKQHEEVENRIASLIKLREIVKRRLIALEELTKLGEPTLEEVKLIENLRKHDKELEIELDKEKSAAEILKKKTAPPVA